MAKHDFARARDAGAVTLEQLTRQEAARRAPESVLLIPLGSIEQHGGHLPVGTDLLVVTGLIDHSLAESAQAHRFVLAPPLPVGCSEHHLPFGALSLAPATYSAVLADLLRGAASFGFRTVLFVNGHGGNHELMRAAAKYAAGELSVVALSYWHLAPEELPTEVPAPGHAGAYETDLVRGLRPDLLTEDRLPLDHVPSAMTAPGGLAGALVAPSRHWVRGEGVSDVPEGEWRGDKSQFLQSRVRALVKALDATVTLHDSASGAS